MSPQETSDFQTRLVEWFHQHQRPLPWRIHYDPYEVWVSEIMLQQTQVTTVLPYYQRWMEALPTIHSVAQADEDTVVKLWEGLGYYSRVRNLQKAARVICDDHGSVFPQDFETILALPGIGRYTAGAVASIAFNQDRPVVDGNVIRVVCRLEDLRDDPKSAAMTKRLWELAADWIPSGEARYFNQGMMELGATVCHVQQPSCLLCPVQSFCKSYHAGSVDQVPAKVKRVKSKLRTTLMALIHKDGSFLIQKRPVGQLMGGLWEFPNLHVTSEQKLEKSLQSEVLKQWGIQVEVKERIATIKHGYTSYKVTLHGYYCVFQSGNLKLSQDIPREWVPLKDLGQYSFPAAQVKLIQKLQKHMEILCAC